MNNSLIQFNADIKKVGDVITLTFVDKLAELVSYGVDVVGIIKVTTPSGIIYGQAPYDTDDFSTPDIDTVNNVSEKIVSLFADGILTKGNYKVSYKIQYNVTQFFEKEVSFYVGFVVPETTLEVSHYINSTTAFLRSRDISEYGITVNNVIKQPTTVLYSQVINYPAGSGKSADTLTSGDVQVQLWSETYGCTMVASIFYNGLFVDGLCLVTLLATNTTTETHFVEDNDCGCAYFQCIANLQAKYDSSKLVDKVAALTYQKLLLEVNMNWMLKSMAESCGYNSEPFCVKIKELAKAENCFCVESTDNTPHVITGSTPTSLVSVSTNWLSGVIPPSSLIGSDGDFYVEFQSLKYIIYLKSSGVWTSQGTYGLKGDTGSNGTNGTNGVAGTSGLNGTTVILAKNVGLIQTFPINTLTIFTTSYTFATNLFTTIGDKLRIYVNFYQNSAINQAVKVAVNAYQLPLSPFEANGDVYYEAEIIYVATNSFLIRVRTSNGLEYSFFDSITITSPTVISFYGLSQTGANIIIQNCFIEKSSGGFLATS